MSELNATALHWRVGGIARELLAHEEIPWCRLSMLRAEGELGPCETTAPDFPERSLTGPGERDR